MTSASSPAPPQRIFTSSWFLFLACVCGLFLYLVLRTPYAVVEPTFYAEDGLDYFSEIATRGFWTSLFVKHRGYYVFGNMILSELAMWGNRYFGGNDVRNVPFAMAVVSYGYFAMLAALPILLLRKRLSNTYLIVLSVLIAGTPLFDLDWVVVGRISNVGYSFVYLATLLIIYRISCSPSLPALVLCDIGLLIAAGTNPVVYPLILFTLIPYMPRLLRLKSSWQSLANDYSFWSLTGLGVGLLTSLLGLIRSRAYVVTDHLGGSFVRKSAVEMLIGREILYPIVYMYYSKFQNWIVLALFAFLCLVLLWVVGRQPKQENVIYLVSVCGLGIFAIASAVFRPGLSSLFDNYQLQVLAHYFYGMNLLATFIITVMIYDLSRRFSRGLPKVALLILLLAIYAPGLVTGGGFGRVDVTQSGMIPFPKKVLLAVTHDHFLNSDRSPGSDGAIIVLQGPPNNTGWWTVLVPRSWAVNSVSKDPQVEWAKTLLRNEAQLEANLRKSQPELFMLPKLRNRKTSSVTQLGIFRRGCHWLLDKSTTELPVPFDCNPTGTVVAADWNGDGRTKLGVFQDGAWKLDFDGHSDVQDGLWACGFSGRATDVPVVGDWNGDGRTEVGLYRRGKWLLDYTGDCFYDEGRPGGDDLVLSFGVEGDVPVVGDWDGSGKDKIGVYRHGTWYLDLNGNGQFDGPGKDLVYQFGGVPGDVPVVGDWNGNGKSKVGVFRNGFLWVLDVNGNGLFDGTKPGQDFAVAFGGIPGDKPLVGHK